MQLKLENPKKEGAIMQNKLLGIINEFGKQLTTSEYNQYVTKLRDYLIPYIIQEKGKDFDVDRIFKDEFTRSDIVNATIYYVIKNQNVESISAVDDYLIALNRLFDQLLFEKYPNPTLMKFKPFSSLSNEIQNKLAEKGISLRTKEVNPSIDGDQFDFIIQYLKDYKKTRAKSHQLNIIIKLLLLYGFSHEKIAEFKIDDYNSNQKTLKVEYERVVKRSIFLELPYSLAIEINEYLDIRNKMKKLNTNFLFTTERNTKITHAFLTDILDSIKKEYFKARGKKLEKNQFTPTGIQKYAIIQMILCGMNQSVISDLTGQKEDIYNDCQNEVNRLKELNRNRYVNHMIRGIPTFDLI